MVKKILIAIGLLVGVLIVAAVLMPSDYTIKRDILINAKPDVVFPYIVSMKNADLWMPWKESDPQVVNTYQGPDEGVGATSSWESPGQMGTGKAEVIAITPNQSVKTKISYTKPMEMNQEADFIIEPVGEQTKMTWMVAGKSPFIPRLMCLITFTNMDKYVGGMFEKGLGKLKNLVEEAKKEK